MFLEAATKVSKKQIESLNENTKVTKKYSLYNCIENLLKARNRKCVAPLGLSLMSLAYIFGGRSRFICQLLSSTGAKGTYPLIKDIILKNSEESSLKKCHDGIEVYYSFDNVQKLFAIHRLYGQNQNKPIARIATSIVKCYPDGLIKSDVQYLLNNNPMKWLYKFSIAVTSGNFYEELDKEVLHEMLQVEEHDMAIVLGRWDYDIQTAINEVSHELDEKGRDFIDEVVAKIRKEKVKMCRFNHENRNVRPNQKLCNVCKAPLIDDVNTCTSNDEDDSVKENIASRVEFARVECNRDKGILFPNVRDIGNVNTPVYQSEGCIFVNPNTYDRLVKVVEDIQIKTGTYKRYTSAITLSKNDQVTVEVWEEQNVRQYVLITVDGLPHKMAIDVLKHCYDCKTCGEAFNCIDDVNSHFQTHNHATFFKRFSNIILKIGGLHLHMNMLRSFVSLNWDIDYAFLVNAIGFKSPKALIFQQKVQDLHKAMDTFSARRTAKLREYFRKFLHYALAARIAPTAYNFEVLVSTNVKNKS